MAKNEILKLVILGQFSIEKFALNNKQKSEGKFRAKKDQLQPLKRQKTKERLFLQAKN